MFAVVLLWAGMPADAYSYLGRVGAFGPPEGEFFGTSAVTVDGQGSIYVVAGEGVQKFDADGKPQRWVDDAAGADGDPSKLYGALDIAADAVGNVYVADPDNRRVVRLSSEGRFIAAWPAGHARALATDAANNIWVGAIWGGATGLAKYSPSGELLAYFPVTGIPEKLAVDDLGRVYVSQLIHPFPVVSRFSSSGALLGRIGSGVGRAEGQFGEPGIRGVAVDHQGHIWVADPYNLRIQEFSAEGAFRTACGSLRDLLFGPSDIATAPNGDLLVSTFTKIVRFREVAGGLEPCDATKPSLSALRLVPSAASTSAAARLLRLRFRLSEPAMLTVRFARDCRRRSGRRCRSRWTTRHLRVRTQGVGSVRLGRVAALRQLKVGRWRIRVRATDKAGNHSSTSEVPLRVTPPAR